MSFSVKRVVLACLPGPLKRLAGRVESSPLGYRLARGAFWSLAGAVISRGLMLVAMIVAARILGKEGFGELGIIQSTVMMFGTFAGFGLGITATKHVAEFREKDPARAGRIIGLSGVVAFGTGSLMSAAVIALAPWLSAKTLAAPHVAPILQLGTGILFFSALNGAQLGALAGFEAFKAIARANLVAGVAAFPLVLGGVWLWGLGGAVGGLVAAQAVTWLVNLIALRLVARRFDVPVRVGGCLREWKVLWRFSLPAVLGAAFIPPIMWIGHTVIVNEPYGYSEMGAFAAAFHWRTIILFLPVCLYRPAAAILTTLAKGHRSCAFKKVLAWYCLVGGGMALLASGCVIVMAPLIMQTYGEDFRGHSLTLVLVSLVAFVEALVAILHPAIASLGRMWVQLPVRVCWGGTFLVLLLRWRSHGANGMAGALLVAYSVYVLALGMAVRGFMRARKNNVGVDHSV